MMPSLYKLADEYVSAAEQLADMDMDEQTIADTLEGLTGTLEVKATNVAAFVRNLEATAEQIKQAEAEMSKRRKAIESRAANIREYLLTNMQRCAISKIESPYFAISIKKNPPAVKIIDEAAISNDYWKQPETPPKVIDKKAIAADLKSGKVIEGAILEQGERLEIK